MWGSLKYANIMSLVSFGSDPNWLNLSHRCVCWIQHPSYLELEMGKDKFHSQNSFVLVSGMKIYVWNGASTAPPIDWSESNCTPHSKSPCPCVEEICVEHHSIFPPLLSMGEMGHSIWPWSVLPQPTATLYPKDETVNFKHVCPLLFTLQTDQLVFVPP